MKSKVCATVALIFMCVMMILRGLQCLYNTGDRGNLSVASVVTLICVVLIIAINSYKEKK